MTEEECVRSTLGGRTKPLTEAIVYTTIYSAILLSGILGNMFTCIVIVCNKYMHTATNFFLFSLAISDLLTLILGKLI